MGGEEGWCDEGNDAVMVEGKGLEVFRNLLGRAEYGNQ